MALTKTEVSQLYILLLGRASEGAGSDYWQNDTQGNDLASVADVMFAVGAVQSYFGSDLDDNQAFIEKIYADTLGRTYDEDPEGIDYWVDELNNGRTKGQVSASLITAVQLEENAGAAQDRFNNRVTVSDYTADNISTYSDSIDFSGFISQVTDDTDTVSDAMADVDAAADSENTDSFTLTAGTDVITGTDGDDLIVGTDETYNATDTIAGGAGDDTLSLFLFDANTDTVAVSGVENIIVRNAYTGTDLDASGWTGVDQMTFSACTAAAAVSGIQNQVDLELKNNSQAVTLTYEDDVLASASAAQAVTVRDSSCTLTIDSGGADLITALEIQAVGTNVLTIEENDITSVTITGWGDLELLSTDTAGTLTGISTVQAASATGDLTLDMSAVDMSTLAGNYVIVTGGSGDDTITTGADGNLIDAGAGDDTVVVGSGLDGDDVLEGGTGDDILSMTSADALSASSDSNILAALFEFESLGFTDAVDIGAALDISLFGAEGVVIYAGLNGDEELSGFESGGTVEIRTDASETDILTITMEGASDVGSDSDVLNIAFNADLEDGDGVYEAAFSVAGINSIAVTTADDTIDGESAADATLPNADDGYMLTLSNDQALDTITVSGDHAFSFTAGGASSLGTILAESMSGNMTLDFNSSFGGTQGVSMTSGSGADTLTGSAYGDVISAGDGDDTVNITAGADQISGGDGADQFVVGAAGLSTTDSYTSITDFSAVSDTVVADTIKNVAGTVTADVTGTDLSGAEASGGSGMTITADVTSGILALGADADEIDTLSEWIQAAYLACEGGKTIGFEYGGNTYILEEATAGDSADSFLELTGVTSIYGLSDTAGANTVIITV